MTVAKCPICSSASNDNFLCREHWAILDTQKKREYCEARGKYQINSYTVTQLREVERRCIQWIAELIIAPAR